MTLSPADMVAMAIVGACLAAAGVSFGMMWQLQRGVIDWRRGFDEGGKFCKQHHTFDWWARERKYQDAADNEPKYAGKSEGQIHIVENRMYIWSANAQRWHALTMPSGLMAFGAEPITAQQPGEVIPAPGTGTKQ